MIVSLPPVSAPMLPQGIDVELPPMAGLPDADGSVMVDLASMGQPSGLEGMGHDDNLAEVLSDNVLAGLAQDLIEAFEADWESNAQDRLTIERGVDLLGLRPGERVDRPFPGATGVRHPMLLEAAVRFQSNASAELLPAAGPARMQVTGDAEPGVEAVSKRKQDWLNYFLMHVDKGYRQDAQQGILLTGLYGSTFKRVFQDPKRGRPCARTLTCFDLVVSANTGSLEDADRVTQIEMVTQHEMRRLQLAGYYCDVDLCEPVLESDATRPGQRQASDRAKDTRHEVLHVHALLDIEGLEHDDLGEATGLPLPYVVSIERESQTVVRLVRDYNEGDGLFLPRQHFVHYKYHPGLGFYGWGLIHLMGQSADAATTMLRQAINAFTLASFPGGFKAKGLKTEKANDPIGPCEFKEIDTGGQPIGAVVMPLPYKDVPPSFSVLMESIVTAGQRMGSTADMAVGDGREDAPVGTTIALIEKATKIESAVIKSMHSTMAQELRLLADLFGKDTDEKYPYLVNGQRGTALAADFQTNDDIVPVSDPNAPTQTQRLALASGKLKLAMEAGPLFDKRAAYEDMMRALGLSDAEMLRLMPAEQTAVSADPVTELQAMLTGAAVQARPDQDHAAHMAVHASQVGMPGIANTPVAAMVAAHMAQHVGMLYRAQIGLALGAQLPPAGPVPPEVEAQITQAVAGVAQQVAQSMPGAAGQATKPDIGPVEAQLKMLELQTKQASEDRKALQTAAGDQIQIARMNVQSQDSEAQRQQKQRDNATTIAAGLISNAGNAADGEHDLKRTALQGIAEIMAEAQRQSGVAVQNRHTAGMGLLDAITSMANRTHRGDGK